MIENGVSDEKAGQIRREKRECARFEGNVTQGDERVVDFELHLVIPVHSLFVYRTCDAQGRAPPMQH